MTFSPETLRRAVAACACFAAAVFARPSSARAEEVSFPVQNTMVAGQFDRPASIQGPVSAVLLIHGSAPSDRNGHLPAGLRGHGTIYRDMAAELVARGFGVLRYDKLCEGASSCPRNRIKPGAIAIAAWKHLAARKDVERARLYILGFSEGSWIAGKYYGQFRLLAKPAGVVLLANVHGPGTIAAIESPILIVLGDREKKLESKGELALRAFQRAHPLVEAGLFVAPMADHALCDHTREVNWKKAGGCVFQPKAWSVMMDWLSRQAAQPVRK
ncbi:MAG: hypothetical protein GMKNLPBB_00452 [Myxococcota bacterium]|nr:hypothetical protein [Myxococcota bacterium]